MKILKDQRGQILLIATLLVAVISAYTLILLQKSTYSTKVSRNINYEAKALWLAEAGLEKAVFCLNQTSGENCGGNFGDSYAGETNVVLNDGTFTTTLSGSPTAKDIVSVGAYNGAVKTVRRALVKAQKTEQVTFTYSLLAGSEGIYLKSGSIVTGDIYSNGDMRCETRAVILNGNLTVAGNNKTEKCTTNGYVKAHEIKDSTVNGDAYYQIISGSTVSGTSYPGSPDPAATPFPITDEMINEWKAEATDGGIFTGNKTVNANASLGPLKITGDLTVKSGKTLTLTGVIYVQGKIHFESNVTVVLDPSFGVRSGLVIADEKIDCDSNGIYVGTPEGGQITFITISAADDAITLSSSGGRAIFYAPYGKAKSDASSHLIQITGRKVEFGAGARVDYEYLGTHPTYIFDITDPGAWQTVPGTRSE